jgi:hypothetical protein
MHLYSDSNVKLHRAASDLENIWSVSRGSERDVDIHDGILIHAHEMDELLKDDNSLTAAAIEEMAIEYTHLSEDLHQILFRYNSRTYHDADDPYIDEREAALKFFGFPSGSRPPEAEVKRVYRAICKRYDPYSPLNNPTEAQHLENEQILREANKHYAVLRPKGGDPTDRSI